MGFWGPLICNHQTEAVNNLGTYYCNWHLEVGSSPVGLCCFDGKMVFSFLFSFNESMSSYVFILWRT